MTGAAATAAVGSAAWAEAHAKRDDVAQYYWCYCTATGRDTRRDMIEGSAFRFMLWMTAARRAFSAAHPSAWDARLHRIVDHDAWASFLAEAAGRAVLAQPTRGAASAEGARMQYRVTMGDPHDEGGIDAGTFEAESAVEAVRAACVAADPHRDYADPVWLSHSRFFGQSGPGGGGQDRSAWYYVETADGLLFAGIYQVAEVVP